MSDQVHPLAPHHLPPFITAPGETDVWMVVMGIFLILAVLAVGNLYLRLHTLPERMAHKSQKLQFEVVAVLGLLALFTHIHLFWIAGLLLALIDLPDFGTPLRSIASSVEKIAGDAPPLVVDQGPDETESASVTAAPEKPDTRSRNRRRPAMLELLLCSMLTILPDYLYRRLVQGKRFGKEITFFSVWFELRWGIVCCLMLTISLITLIFYFHPSSNYRNPVLQDGADRSRNDRARRRSPCRLQ